MGFLRAEPSGNVAATTGMCISGVSKNDQGESEFNPIRIVSMHPANANDASLPDDSAKCFFTDPPYYDAVPYADLIRFLLCLA